MGTTLNRVIRVAVTCICILTCAFFAVPDQAMGQTAVITPARINLTSDGLADAIQAILRMPIEDGCTLSGFDVQLLFGNVWLADAYSFTYCDYDQTFIAGFDKQAVADNPALAKVAGDRIRLTVTGQYSALDAEGTTIVRPFSYTGYVWIMAPGNK